MFIVFSPFTNPDKYTTTPAPWVLYFFESTPLIVTLSIVLETVIYIPCSLAKLGFCTFSTFTSVLSLYEYPEPLAMSFQTTAEGSLVVVSSDEVTALSPVATIKVTYCDPSLLVTLTTLYALLLIHSFAFTWISAELNTWTPFPPFSTFSTLTPFISNVASG